jgi:hypothetical protein
MYEERSEGNVKAAVAMLLNAIVSGVKILSSVLGEKILS